jgi:hypothetical protein
VRENKRINRLLAVIKDKSSKEKITEYWFFRKNFEVIRKGFYHRRRIKNEKGI